MTGKLLFLLISVVGLVFVFVTNWFWRWLAIPIVAIFAYDIINTFFDQRRKDKDDGNEKLDVQK